MACVSAVSFTISLSDDGGVYFFGVNKEVQLGLQMALKDNGQQVLGESNHKIISLPIRIPNFPKIKQVSCAVSIIVCVDEEGLVWSFGKNDRGLQLENTKNCNVPQKILDIPLVVSVSCGFDHICIITIDSDLWSCGGNNYGQLCLGNKLPQKKFQKTSFSNISKISTSYCNTLFQNDEGEIYSCGYNDYGQLGLGHFKKQITPIPIPNLPSKIVQFVCGSIHYLFLDSEGNVFSVGGNKFGPLGLGHNRKMNVLTQIPNIPPVQTISCTSTSSYLLDFEGNVWSFGCNEKGQLGHGDLIPRTVPTKIESLRDIQQVSLGSFGSTHFLAKDSQNKIFATGNNAYGQLGLDAISEDILIPKEINSKYFAIWRLSIIWAKSARK